MGSAQAKQAPWPQLRLCKVHNVYIKSCISSSSGSRMRGWPAGCRWHCHLLLGTKQCGSKRLLQVGHAGATHARPRAHCRCHGGPWRVGARQLHTAWQRGGGPGWQATQPTARNWQLRPGAETIGHGWLQGHAGRRWRSSGLLRRQLELTERRTACWHAATVHCSCCIVHAAWGGAERCC